MREEPGRPTHRLGVHAHANPAELGKRIVQLARAAVAMHMWEAARDHGAGGTDAPGSTTPSPTVASGPLVDPALTRAMDRASNATLAPAIDRTSWRGPTPRPGRWGGTR